MNTEDQTYTEREDSWDQQWASSNDDVLDHPTTELDNSDELTGFPDSTGTTDPSDAVRDAEPYMPPIDPPVLPGGWEGIHVAGGFGTSGDEEAARDGGSLSDLDVEEEAMLALRQDALTSHFALRVRVRNGVARLTGVVGDIDDAEHAMSLLAEIPGVEDVVDDTSLDPTLQ